MSEIIVVAKAKAKKGSEADLEKAVRAVIRLTHEEAGCLKYALSRSLEDAASFMITERWASKEAWDKHLVSLHIQELFGKLPALVAAPVDMQVFQPLPEGQAEKGVI